MGDDLQHAKDNRKAERNEHPNEMNWSNRGRRVFVQTRRFSEQIEKLIDGETRMADQCAERSNGKFLVLRD